MNQVAELAERLGVSDRTVRRAVADGLVRVSRSGPRRAHVDVRERAYLTRAWPLLSELRVALRTEPSVRLAVLFGSFARGDDGPGSDVDLVVALAGDERARLYDLQDRLAHRLGRDVQVLALQDAERESWLLAEIVRDGRVLTDRDTRWPAYPGRLAMLRRRADAELEARATRALDRVAAMGR